jgi:hypothetical protein
LGFADKIIVKDTEDREDAVLLGGKAEKLRVGTSNPIQERAETLRQQLKEAKNEPLRIQLEKQIANLSSAVGVIRVGSSHQCRPPVSQAQDRKWSIRLQGGFAGRLR